MEENNQSVGCNHPDIFTLLNEHIQEVDNNPIVFTFSYTNDGYTISNVVSDSDLSWAIASDLTDVIEYHYAISEQGQVRYRQVQINKCTNVTELISSYQYYYDNSIIENPIQPQKKNENIQTRNGTGNCFPVVTITATNLQLNFSPLSFGVWFYSDFSHLIGLFANNANNRWYIRYVNNSYNAFTNPEVLAQMHIAMIWKELISNESWANTSKECDDIGEISPYCDEEFDQLTPCEKELFLRNLTIIPAVYSNRQRAWDAVNFFFPNASECCLEDGLGDAFRHAFFSALNTDLIGPDLAEELSDCHENFPANYGPKRDMDLQNDTWGRNWMNNYVYPTNLTPAEQIEHMVISFYSDFIEANGNDSGVEIALINTGCC